MDGEEFRGLRVAAGLSVRAAAKEHGVTPSTIQRWEAGASIPSTAAERMLALAGMPRRLASAHVLGHLAAVLAYVSHGYTPRESAPGWSTTPVDSGTRAGIGRTIERAMQQQPERFAEMEGEIQELFAALDNYPEMMDPEQTAEFWRGYYTRRKALEARAAAATDAESRSARS